MSGRAQSTPCSAFLRFSGSCLWQLLKSFETESREPFTKYFLINQALISIVCTIYVSFLYNVN